MATRSACTQTVTNRTKPSYEGGYDNVVSALLLSLGTLLVFQDRCETKGEQSCGAPLEARKHVPLKLASSNNKSQQN
eukprot:811316-Amphidinium_carterae.2